MPHIAHVNGQRLVFVFFNVITHAYLHLPIVCVSPNPMYKCVSLQSIMCEGIYLQFQLQDDGPNLVGKGLCGGRTQPVRHGKLLLITQSSNQLERVGRGHATHQI